MNRLHTLHHLFLNFIITNLCLFGIKKVRERQMNQSWDQKNETGSLSYFLIWYINRMTFNEKPCFKTILLYKKLDICCLYEYFSLWHTGHWSFNLNTRYITLSIYFNCIQKNLLIWLLNNQYTGFFLLWFRVELLSIWAHDELQLCALVILLLCIDNTICMSSFSYYFPLKNFLHAFTHKR